jgi:hypothetical protein
MEQRFDRLLRLMYWLGLELQLEQARHLASLAVKTSDLQSEFEGEGWALKICDLLSI